MFYDAEKVDIIAVRKDGGIELLIISTGKFDDSKEQQDLLLTKVNNYIEYLNSNEFNEDYPGIDNKWIIVSYNRKPTLLLNTLFKKIEMIVKNEGINFELKRRLL